MHRWLPCCLALACVPALAEPYFPGPNGWATVSPAEAGFDPDRLSAAVAFARSAAVTEPADLRVAILEAFGREPNFRILGPTTSRAEDSGMIVREGRIVAEWGDVDRVDMTFSVVKSYLATVAGLALRDGRIASLDDPARSTVRGPTFAGEHNGAITWRHLLNQTSEWAGTLWSVPDWADRPEGPEPARWPQRTLEPPGSRFEYNDVRVNVLAFALLQVLREPLPVVLRRELMDPIGASPTWRWHGYENSWVELDGLRMQSVSGGGHFGGGLFIATRDHARFGLLMMNRGVWGDERLLPDDWFDRIREPARARPDYGLMWWLNTQRERIPEAPEAAYWAAGFGGNYLYVDECNELVVVLRWIPDLPGVIARVLQALEAPHACAA